MTIGIYTEKLKTLAAGVSDQDFIEGCDIAVERENPFCGDRVTLTANFSNHSISEMAQSIRGCLLCRAAAATLVNGIEGLTAEALAEVLFDLEKMLKDGEDRFSASNNPWHELSIFLAVSEHRARHGCVLLPFKTMSDLFAKVHGGAEPGVAVE